MSRSSDRILGNSGARSKETGNEVHSLTRCRNNDGKSIKRGYAQKIRLKILNFRFAIENRQ